MLYLYNGVLLVFKKMEKYVYALLGAGPMQVAVVPYVSRLKGEQQYEVSAEGAF